MRRSTSLLSAVLLLAATLGFPAQAAEVNRVPQQAQAAASGTVSMRIIVKLRDAASGADSGAISRLASRNRLSLAGSRHITGSMHVMQLASANAQSMSAALARLRADPQVEYADADQRRYIHAAPNDTDYINQWYLQNDPSTPSAANAAGAWDITTGSNAVVIADVDTGVRYDHPDLLAVSSGGRLLPGYDFVSDPTVANDGDGRDADASDPGDWITQSDTTLSTFNGCTVEDSSWHGTRVSGMLGALTNNGLGIAGLSWSSLILPVRVLGKCGGYDSDIQPGMLWAAGIAVDGVPANPYPAKIINMSLGGTDTCSSSYQDVIDQITALGVLIVVSAGNEGGPVDTPANCVGVAGIAGLRQVGTKVGFSSLGPQVALSAPAGNCVNSSGACLYSLETTTNSGTTTPATNTYTDQYNYNLGTSFSAPIVSASAALMLAVNGNLNSAQLISRLQEGATKPFPVSSDPTVPVCHVPASSSDVQTSECSCTTSTCGAGMANSYGAVNAALRPIAAIAVPASITAGQSVTLSALGSAAACGHSILTYAWSIVSGSATINGAASSSASVTAPVSGSFTVQLIITDDTGRQDTAQVTVYPSSATTSAPASAGSKACLTPQTFPITVTVAPASTSVEVGAVQSFTATVINTSDTGVSWQVNGVTGGNATVGTIDSNGNYTAPANAPSPATVTVTAVSMANSSSVGSASVTITALVTVSVSPATVDLGTHGTQSFTATVANTANTTVSWQVNGIAGGNSTVGSIDSNGKYTAPGSVPNPATVTVTAVSAADSQRAGSAEVTISAASGSSGGGGGGGAGDPASLLALAMAGLVAACRRKLRRA